MARRPNDKLLYLAFQNFLDSCLVNNRSLLWPGKEVWTLDNIVEVKERLVDAPILGDTLSFEEKLKKQLAGASPECWALICDIYYIYFLPSTFIKLGKKQRDIQWAASQGDLVLLELSADIWDAQKAGFTRTGLKYHFKYAQFWLILLFALQVKKAKNPGLILSNAAELQLVLDQILERITTRTDRAYDMRHAILYMAFPDNYERIISTGDKEKIVEAFGDRVQRAIPKDIDQAILKIRAELAKTHDKPDRPFDFYQDLMDQWRPKKELPPDVVTIGASTGPVTIPEEDESITENKTAEAAIKAHTEIQYMLLKLGSDMGLDIWVARNDRSKELQGHRFSELTRIKTALPTKFDEVTTRTIELIDVLWLKANAIVAAFEIESTTSIYSGLLRMADLIAMQPNLNIPLYLVAPDERRSKVINEINRPTFSRLDTPMSQMCRYIPFSSLRNSLAKIGSVTKYLKTDFLDEISESCEIEET